MKSLRNSLFMVSANCGRHFGILVLLMLLSAGGVRSALSQAGAKSVAPSNKQLASPEIQRKVDALIKKMTLDEKLGQLVQYSDSGYSGQAKTADETANPGKNPTAPHPVDALELVSTGRLGSLLNLVGQQRTNELQHAAVEKSRLHIPLMFGADIIHGYKTTCPMPRALAASFEPELVSSLAHISAS